MRVWSHLGLGVLCLALVGQERAQAGSGAALAQARKALRSDAVSTLEYVGSGTWNLFGQSPSPSAPDPEFEMTSYTADINYVTGAKHVVIFRNPALISSKRWMMSQRSVPLITVVPVGKRWISSICSRPSTSVPSMTRPLSAPKSNAT